MIAIIKPQLLNLGGRQVLKYLNVDSENRMSQFNVKTSEIGDIYPIRTSPFWGFTVLILYSLQFLLVTKLTTQLMFSTAELRIPLQIGPS